MLIAWVSVPRYFGGEFVRVWRSIWRIGGGLSFGSRGEDYCVKVRICIVLKDVGFGEDELILSNGVSRE